mmetsp:Transcript_19865/g.39802  ORF Transcript_19865/g.39802 Transcript_19865/m.39802 type:complete len:81 (+) Transcript_19865:21-263(+)
MMQTENIALSRFVSLSLIYLKLRIFRDQRACDYLPIKAAISGSMFPDVLAFAFGALFLAFAFARRLLRTLFASGSESSSC